MKIKFIEAHNDKKNWAKMAIFRFGAEEFAHVSAIAPEYQLLNVIGWEPRVIWVLDLATREGAAFKPGGLAKADLEKHKVWVCPLFQPFLEWLYKQDLTDLEALPSMINLPDAGFEWSGHRRGGAKIVHALKEGVTLCGMRGTPSEWSEEHNWIAWTERQLVTCRDCIGRLET